MTNNHLPNGNIKFANIKLAGIIFALLFGLINYPLQAQSQVAKQQNNSVIKKSKFVLDFKFPSNGTPKADGNKGLTRNDLAFSFPNNNAPTGRRKGGGRRDGCSNLSQPEALTALVPGEEKSNKSHLGYTVSEYPTFWIHIPQRPESAKYGEFVLQDKKSKTIYERKLTLPKESGIIGIDLPKESKYALQNNNTYQWYFKLLCNEEQNSSEYVYVNAWLQRIPLTPDLETQLKFLKKEKSVPDINNSVWYDTLTILAEKKLMYSSYPEVIKLWMHLLKSVDLGELASAPIIMIDK
jgi:hypothetical protein